MLCRQGSLELTCCVHRHGVLPAASLTSDPSARVHLVGGQRFKALGRQCASEGVPLVKLSTQKWCMAAHEQTHGRHAGGVLAAGRGGGGPVCTTRKTKPTGPAVYEGCHFILYRYVNRRHARRACTAGCEVRLYVCSGPRSTDSSLFVSFLQSPALLLKQPLLNFGLCMI